MPTDDTPSPGRWLDLHVMLLTGGRERTEEEYRVLFVPGGLLGWLHQRFPRSREVLE